MSDMSILEQSRRDDSKPKYDAILIYNTKDLGEAKAIHDQLESRGLNIWIDYKHAFGGDPLNTIIVEAMQASQTAIVLFGTKGLGSWQEFELETLRQLYIDKQLFKIIPVLLNGVQKPPLALGVAGLRHIRFTNEADEQDILDELERAVTGLEPKHSRWPFEIHVPVDLRTNDCFVACPLRKEYKLFQIISRVVKKAGLEVVQFQDNETEQFTPNVAKGIRGTEIVIVDCTPEKESGVPAAEMLYELGLARALGKPTIVLTDMYYKLPCVVTAKQLLRYNEIDLANGQFEKRLSEELNTVLSNLDYHLLTENDPEDPDDIYAIPSRLSCLRISLWKRLRRILLFGIELHGIFREYAKYSHNLKRDINRVTHDRQDPKQLDNTELHARNWNNFYTTFHQHYLPKYLRHEEACHRLLSGRCEELEHSFKFLTRHFLDSKRDLHGLLKESLMNSCGNFSLGCQFAITFLTTHNKLIRTIPAPDSKQTESFVVFGSPGKENGKSILKITGNDRIDDERELEPQSYEYASYLHGLCRELSYHADLVNVSINAMMTALLEVIAKELSFGDDEDASNTTYSNRSAVSDN